MINLQLFALSDDKLNSFSFNHASQVDELGKATGNYQTVQQYFDSRAEELRVKYNSLIDQLEALTGAGNIGAKNVITQATSEIQAELDRLYQQILDVVSSGITPGTPGYYLRTNLAGTSVEWSDIDAELNGTKLAVTNNRIAIDELLAYNGVTSSVDVSDSVFYDFPNSTKQLTAGTIDRAKCYIATVNTGTNSVDVDAILSGKDGEAETDLTLVFLVGEEVTLQNATVKERLTVSNVTATTVTFDTNIAGTFPAGANLYRSNLNALNGVYKFGGFSEETTIDRTTPVQVVNQAYTPVGRPVRMDNGDLIAVAYETSARLRVYRSTDNGANYSEISNAFIGVATLHGALTTDGTNVHLAYTTTGAIAYVINFDPSTVGGTLPTAVNIDTGQNSTGGIDIISAPNGDLHAAWASKNATRPNSFNVRYSVSTDNGVSWSTVTEISIYDSATSYAQNPAIVINSLGNPVIIAEFRFNTIYGITSYTYNGSTWNSKVDIYTSTSVQEKPSADVRLDGKIIITWVDRSLGGGVSGIRFSYSNDNGSTWQTSVVIYGSVSNEYGFAPSITRDLNDIIYIVFYGRDTGVTSLNGIHYKTYDLTTLSNRFTIDHPTSGNHSNPSTCNNYRNFEKPLTVYETTEDSSVYFYGEWTEGTETDITDIDIRLNIEAWETVDSIASWLYSNNTANVTVDASLSIHASGADESYIDLADTEIEVDASNNYYVASGSVTTAQKLATLKYNLTRALTTDDVDIKRIQGAVA